MAENWEREAAARVSGDYGRRSFDDQRTSSRLPHLSPRARGSFEMTHNPAHRGSFVMEHVSHLPRSSGRFSGYSLDAQQLPGARVNNQLRTSLRPDGARHFNAQDPTSGVDPELLHDETRFVVDFWQGKVAGPGYAARKSFRQSLGQQQPLPIPPPIEETMRAVLKHNNLVLDKVDQEKFDLFDVWLNKQAYLRTFRPSEILLVICGILEMEKTYDILNSNYEISELKKIHASLSEGGIFKPLSEESYLGDYQLMKPNPEYSFSSLFGTPKAGVDRFITSLENRVVLEDHLRAAMVSHLISTYENAGRLVLDKNDVRLKKHPKLPRKDKRPQITRDERFYLEFLDLDFTSYDGYTAAFCAAATCRHQNSEPTEIKKDVVKYLELNKTLSELAMHNVSFIQPSDGKLDNRKRLFITSLFTIIFGFAALFFWLITTYSATHFSVNYKCEAVFGGLVLQPYGVILANIIFFKLFERTINSTIDFFSYLYYKYHNDEDKLILKMSVEEEGGIRAMEDGKMRQDAGGLWASLRQKTPTSPAKATAKDEETETKNLYVMHQYLIAWKQDSHYRESDFFIQTPFIFFYLQLLYGFVVEFVTNIFRRLCSKTNEDIKIEDPVEVDNRIMEFLTKFFIELVLRFLVIFFVQTMYNYACTVYQFPIPMTPQQYLQVIVRDYELRTQTYCFFQRTFNSGAAGIVLFTSFI